MAVLHVRNVFLALVKHDTVFGCDVSRFNFDDLPHDSFAKLAVVVAKLHGWGLGRRLDVPLLNLRHDL